MKQMHSGMYMLIWWFTELNVTAHVFRAYNYAFILIFARQGHSIRCAGTGCVHIQPNQFPGDI